MLASQSYSPLCFFSRGRLPTPGARLGTGHWRAALESLCQSQQVPELEVFVLPLGTPAHRFKAELDAAIEQAGFIDRTSLLNKEGRKSRSVSESIGEFGCCSRAPQTIRIPPNHK
jgi:hypothetical protein